MKLPTSLSLLRMLLLSVSALYGYILAFTFLSMLVSARDILLKPSLFVHTVVSLRYGPSIPFSSESPRSMSTVAPTTISSREIHGPGNSACRSIPPANRTGARSFPLRILPLGASITYGLLSSDGNGYRADLEDELRRMGWVVNMVGSVHAGKMKDNANEGHSGARIDEVTKFAEKDIAYQPNLILINAGTNDAVQNKAAFPVNKVDERMDKLLDLLFSHIPETTIILSTLLINGQPGGVNSRIKDVINPKYRNIVRKRKAKGQRIALAEMYEANATSRYSIGLSDLKDGTHPTDAGYRKMAAIWLAAIEEVEKEKLLQPPTKIITTSNSSSGATKPKSLNTGHSSCTGIRGAISTKPTAIRNARSSQSQDGVQVEQPA